MYVAPPVVCMRISRPAGFVLGVEGWAGKLCAGRGILEPPKAQSLLLSREDKGQGCSSRRCCLLSTVLSQRPGAQPIVPHPAPAWSRVFLAVCLCFHGFRRSQWRACELLRVGALGDGKTSKLKHSPCWDRIRPFPEGGWVRYEIAIAGEPEPSQEAAEK